MTSSESAYAIALRLGIGFGIAEYAQDNKALISSIPIEAARRLLGTLSANHAFWWPLVFGDSLLEQVLVFEDAWGALSIQLAPFARELIAAFPTDHQAALARRDPRWPRNATVTVCSDPLSCEAIWIKRPSLIAIVRPSNTWTSSRELSELFRLAARNVEKGGAIVAIESLAPSAIRRLLRRPGCADGPSSPRRPTRAQFSRSVSDPIYIALEPTEAAFSTPPEFFRSRRRGVVAAAQEAIRTHRLRRGSVLDFVSPPSMAAIPNQRDSIAMRILSRQEVTSYCAGRCDINQIVAGNGGVTVLLAGSSRRQGSDVVVRIGRHPDAVRRVETNYSRLQQLADHNFGGIVPRPLARIEPAPGVLATVETCLPGVPLYTERDPRRKLRMMIRSIDILNDLTGPAVAKAPLDGESFQRLVGAPIERLAALSADDAKDRLMDIHSTLRRVLTLRQFPLRISHGDFKAGNILVDANGATSAIIDWDCAQADDLPLMDELALFGYEGLRDAGGEKRTSLAAVLFEEATTPSYLEYLRHAARQIDLNDSDLAALSAVFWLRNAESRCSWISIAHGPTAALWFTPGLRRIQAALQA